MTSYEEDLSYEYNLLSRVSNRLSDDAKRLGFEIQCLGGLLKIRPIGVPTHLFLELDEGYDPKHGRHMRIYGHRNSSLTSRYKGRAVSFEWVLGFMKANSDAAFKLMQTAKDREERRQQENLERARISAPSEPQRRRVPGSSRICPECRGQYSWVDGNHDEPKTLQHCRHCEGGFLYDYEMLTVEQFAELAMQQSDDSSGK